MTEKKQILKSASIISLVTIVSRILGYVRDQRISFLLGTTLSADAFVLAYRLPNLFRRLVADGVVTASFIPVFTSYMRETSSDDLWRFGNRLFWTLALVLAIATVLGVIFSPVVIQSFSSPEDRSSSYAEAVALNRIIFPYLFFAGLAALGMVSSIPSTNSLYPLPPLRYRTCRLSYSPSRLFGITSTARPSPSPLAFWLAARFNS